MGIQLYYDIACVSIESMTWVNRVEGLTGNLLNLQ